MLLLIMSKHYAPVLNQSCLFHYNSLFFINCDLSMVFQQRVFFAKGLISFSLQTYFKYCSITSTHLTTNIVRALLRSPSLHVLQLPSVDQTKNYTWQISGSYKCSKEKQQQTRQSPLFFECSCVVPLGL